MQGTCDNERLFVARYCRFRCHTTIENAQELVTRSGLSRRRCNQIRCLGYSILWLRRWSPRSVLSRIERSATTSLLKRPADMVATMCRAETMIGQTIVIDAGRYFH
jgi:hypothetical protein